MTRHGFIFALVLASVTVSAAMAEPKRAVRISDEDCRWLVAHRPADDVTFKPGVDVHGQPVPPADLPDTRRIELPEVIAIPLHVPLREYLDAHSTSLARESEIQVGTITVNRSNGEVLYEGQTLVPAENERLILACRRMLHRK